MVDRAVTREVTEVTRDVLMIFIGSNVPNGLELQLYEMKDSREMTPQGPNTVKRAFKKGKPIWLKPAASRFGVFPDHQVYGGYAITSIPKAHWDQWCAQNEDSALIENRGLLAGASIDELRAKIQSCRQDKVKSGMEPIDPKNPPRVGGKVTPADGTKLALQ